MPRRRRPKPGYVTLHRLNRTEYANAIRDLLALEVDPATLLPVDGAEHGFDNIANVLQVSPSFIEQYLERRAQLERAGRRQPAAARRRRAVHDRQRARRSSSTSTACRSARAAASHRALLPGRRRVPAQHRRSRDGRSGASTRSTRTRSIALLDGRKFFELEIGGGEDLKELDQIGAPAVDEINARLKNIPFTATAGVHTARRDVPAPLVRGVRPQLCVASAGRRPGRVMTLSRVEVFGPVNATGSASTPSRDKIFVCYPKMRQRAETSACAERDRRRLAQRGVPRRVQRRRPARG